jgi:imidazoleglycerol phosphate synthase glutamine amidotransferase subunit HisH
VDLDAATGRGSNAELVREILRDVEASFQVGGGVRESDDIERLLHEGERFPSMVRAGRTVGVQFHPEKSSRAGVAFIGAFLEEAAR